MELSTLNYWKAQKLAKRADKLKSNKVIEYSLKLELGTMLTEKFAEFDSIMIEVPQKVLNEFLNVLSDESFSWVVVNQIDSNKFILSEGEFDL